jgi:enoyl-CoA hydratase
LPTSDLSIERPAPYIAVLRYSRPQSLNPLNVAVRREMAEHLNTLAEDDGVRVVVLAGTEKAFAAGADLVEMSKADAVEMHGWNTAKSWKAIGAFPKPLIAACRASHSAAAVNWRCIAISSSPANRRASASRR